MKYLKTFENYDSPDVPKISDEELKDMTNIRPYYNKFQQGFINKGSADLNFGIYDKRDQEKQDIMTIFGEKADKYFNNLDLLKRDADFDRYRGGTASLAYRLTKEIETKNHGNTRINVEFGFEHFYTDEISGFDDLKDLDEYAGKNRIYMYCTVKSFYSKEKEDKETLKFVLDDDEDMKNKALKAFRVEDATEYTDEERTIAEKERKFDEDNFFYRKKNISHEVMDKEIKHCAEIYEKFLNYINAEYDITKKDLK